MHVILSPPSDSSMWKKLGSVWKLTFSLTLKLFHSCFSWRQCWSSLEEGLWCLHSPHCAVNKRAKFLWVFFLLWIMLTLSSKERSPSDFLKSIFGCNHVVVLIFSFIFPLFLQQQKLRLQSYTPAIFNWYATTNWYAVTSLQVCHISLGETHLQSGHWGT